MAQPNEMMQGIQKAAEQRLGKPTLTTAHAIAQSLAIGPVFSAVFLGALIAGAAGSIAPLTVLLAAVGALGLGYVITLYAKNYYGAGAIYEYLRLGANPFIGLFAAMVYFIGLVFLGAGGIYIAIGLTVTKLIGILAGITVNWWFCGIVFALIVFYLNHRGVKVAANFQLALSLLSSIPLLILAVAIIIKGGAAGNTLQAFNPVKSSSSAIFAGILFAITLFTGFETAASLGEETANPQRSIPIAVLTVLGITSVFYLVMIYSSDIGFGLNHADKWASDASPLATLATKYVGNWLATLIDVALILDMLAVGTAFTSTAARGWFALARHGLLPDVLAKQSKHGTPIGGNIITLIVALILTSVAPLTAIDSLTFFGVTVAIGAILIELIYIILAVYATKILSREKFSWWKWLLLVLAVITPVLGLKASVWPIPPFPQNISVWVALVTVAISGIWAAVLSLHGKLEVARHPYTWDNPEQLEVGSAS